MAGRGWRLTFSIRFFTFSFISGALIHRRTGGIWGLFFSAFLLHAFLCLIMILGLTGDLFLAYFVLLISSDFAYSAGPFVLLCADIGRLKMAAKIGCVVGNI